MTRSLLGPFVFATLLPLSLAACASSATGSASGSRSAADGETFTLQAGEQVTLADASTLRYVRLINDSRCPPKVQCVWEGDAILAMQWAPAGGTAQDFELHTGKEPRSHALGGRSVHLESLARGAAPAATFRVDAGG